MPAKMVEKHHQNSHAAKEIEIRRGSSAYRVIGHSIRWESEEVESTF